MEDIVSSEENVIPICCENHCYKDINEDKINIYIISGIIYLKLKRKEHVVTVISNISVISTYSIFVRRGITQLLIHYYRKN